MLFLPVGIVFLLSGNSRSLLQYCFEFTFCYYVTFPEPGAINYQMKDPGNAFTKLFRDLLHLYVPLCFACRDQVVIP